MSKSIGVFLAIGFLCLLWGPLPGEANGKRNSYKIKSRPVRDLADALIQLHKLLSPKFTPEQRCQRQAVALSAVNRGQTSQFQIADIALARKEEIEKRYNEINIELLRNLYINASVQYLEKKLVDASLIEVLGCLRSGFRKRDAKARSFLNGQELNTVIEQFEAVSKQPLKVLIEGDTHRTGLDFNKFDESVKSLVRSWLGDDEERLRKLFDKGEPGGEEKRPETESGNNEGAEQGAFAQAGVSISEQAKMEEEEQEYLETVFGSLMEVYESLPEEAELADRCHAYNAVIQAEKEQIFQDEFIQQLVSKTSKGILEERVKQADLMPDEKTREDFLFIVETFDPLRAGPAVWLDLNECISKWAAEDENVVRYLEDPDHVALVNQLTTQLDNEDSQAYAQATAEAGPQQ